MKWAGKIGFASPVKLRPGVSEDSITERDYLGDVLQRTERLDHAGQILPNARITTSISVLSDGVLKERYSDIRYISFMGNNWAVNSVIHKPPRMEIYLAEEYNGPTP